MVNNINLPIDVYRNLVLAFPNGVSTAFSVLPSMISGSSSPVPPMIPILGGKKVT